MPLLSIITVVLNDEKNISKTIKSVIDQKTNFDFEYIVIDGNSSDKTKQIIKTFEKSIDIFISETDNGIYDAINKGINFSSGDFIGLLHSGDIYFNNNIINKILSNGNYKYDIIFSDCLIYDYSKSKILRYYFSNIFHKYLFNFGWMPPHPGCFIKKKIFEKYGYYSINYKIASDFDFLLKASLNRKILWKRSDTISVIMNNNGISSQIKNKILINTEIRKVLREQKKFIFSYFIYFRYFIRLFEFLIKPKLTNFKNEKS